ncbi:spore coat protein CotJB [Blautia liquoris]|uniref:Spore coat protein CotJB n=1 Tax=Blautia liquoris TaxID=2779518 RepID=A0A7M2RMJ9_9FIRM|nr:spore coat protein CotJB [Blautia liquoris]QOV20582.1 spore coat protein CotJB [Blautia liquoris]
MNDNRMNQQQLLCTINELSFAIVDVSLYLDTHPDDQDALDYFHEKSVLRKKAVDRYTTMCGPLTIEAADDRASGNWDWVTQPWPWEVRKGGRR